MTQQNQAYFLALASALCFSGASIFFTDFSRKISPLWMNAFKALVAWICFGVALLVGARWVSLEAKYFFALFASGVIGLAIGDIFLLTAYARMGSARTLILFGFQPLFLAVAAYFIFDQKMTWISALAVLFFIACLFTFSLEKFREFGHWEVFGLVAALIAVLLDNTGVILTRWSFDHAPAMTSFQANFIRCSGAMAFFLLFGSVYRIHFRSGWQRLGPRGRLTAVAVSFGGTFLSLLLYLTAIKIGQLASIAGLGAASPILSSLMESIHMRKRPTPYLIVGLAFFVGGFSLLALA